MTIEDEDYKKITKLLKYAVDKGSPIESWKICNAVLIMLGQEGSGKLNYEFVEKIVNDWFRYSTKLCWWRK